ncbi:MAG: phenylalanine--tRNA ligase beta subunit-related protein [Candidatus Omnitrophica bacterium]|nr:phenylalanine--tRNA ligase beta subunit-related protein [Candidatus Omnitrophota bacterium]
MFKIEPSVKAKVAFIEIEGVVVSRDDTGFKNLLSCAENYRTNYLGQNISDVAGVTFARDMFRSLGIDPTKHRPASESLLRRALKDKGFFSVNSLVDVANWCSLDFLLPICVYDRDKINGRVTVRLGLKNEVYQGLTGRPVNLSDRYTVSDELGPFGSAITDSVRSAVDLTTTRALLDIIVPFDYSDVLLTERAKIFSQRVILICGGTIKGITVIT